MWGGCVAPGRRGEGQWRERLLCAGPLIAVVGSSPGVRTALCGSLAGWIAVAEGGRPLLRRRTSSLAPFSAEPTRISVVFLQGASEADLQRAVERGGPHLRSRSPALEDRTDFAHVDCDAVGRNGRRWCWARDSSDGAVCPGAAAGGARRWRELRGRFAGDQPGRSPARGRHVHW
jgi:hypothetical protein